MVVLPRLGGGRDVGWQGSQAGKVQTDAVPMGVPVVWCECDLYRLCVVLQPSWLLVPHTHTLLQPWPFLNAVMQAQ